MTIDLSYRGRQDSAKNRRRSVVAKDIKVIISELFNHGKLNNPLFKKNITVYHVEVARNFSVANVYVNISFCDDKDMSDNIIKELNLEKSNIKRLMSSRLKVKRIPNIYFLYYELLDKVNDIELILDKLNHQ